MSDSTHSEDTCTKSSNSYESCYDVQQRIDYERDGVKAIRGILNKNICQRVHKLKKKIALEIVDKNLFSHHGDLEKQYNNQDVINILTEVFDELDHDARSFLADRLIQMRIV